MDLEHFGGDDGSRRTSRTSQYQTIPGTWIRGGFFSSDQQNIWISPHLAKSILFDANRVPPSSRIVSFCVILCGGALFFCLDRLVALYQSFSFFYFLCLLFHSPTPSSLYAGIETSTQRIDIRPRCHVHVYHDTRRLGLSLSALF